MALKAALLATSHDQDKWRSISLLRQDFNKETSQDEKDRHAMANQKTRRASMAAARNTLLTTTLTAQHDWVLWLDADIVETPTTLLQDMMSHNRDLLVANCYQRYEGGIRPYDFNNWVDSPAAQALADKMSNDDILLEGMVLVH